MRLVMTVYSDEHLPEGGGLLLLCHANSESGRMYLVIQMLMPKRVPGRVQYLLQNHNVKKHHMPVFGDKICSNCEDSHRRGIVTCGPRHSLCWFCVIGLMRETDLYTCEVPLCAHHQCFEGEQGMLQPGHRFEKPLFEDYFHPGQLDDEEPIFLPPEPAVNPAASNEQSSDGYSDDEDLNDFI